MRICLILPTLNEEIGIKKVIESVPNPVVNDVVLVDGFSGDNTVINAERANRKSFGVKVIFQEGRGKGMAFQSFLKKMDLNGYDIFVMFDADYTYDPNEIKKIVSPIENGEADVVIGNRFASPGIKETMSLGTFFGNRMLNFAANLMYLKNPRDLCTGYWAFSNEFLKKVKISAKGFDLEANLFTEAMKKGFKIKTVGIRYGERIGKKKLKYSDGFLILLRLVKERLLW